MSDSIEEAVKAKYALEDLILKNIREFEAAYGVRVQSINLTHMDSVGTGKFVHDVSVVVEL